MLYLKYPKAYYKKNERGYTMATTNIIEIVNNIEEVNAYCEQYDTNKLLKERAETLQKEAATALLVTSGEFAGTYGTKAWKFTVVGAKEKDEVKVNTDALKEKFPVIYEQLKQAGVLTEIKSTKKAYIMAVKAR